jgi:hypothetical protein
LDLCNLYTAHGMLADHNGDGRIDAVHARIVLRRDASHAEQLAAINIAARLGFETMSLAPPLAVVEDEAGPWPAQACPIVVGSARGAIRALERDGRPLLQPLSPGQGLLQLLPAHGSVPQGLVVAGGDDEGLAAAAALLSSRLPYLWHVGANRPTFDDLAADIRAWLAGSGAEGCAVAVVAAYIDAARPGIARLEVEVQGIERESLTVWPRSSRTTRTRSRIPTSTSSP